MPKIDDCIADIKIFKDGNGFLIKNNNKEIILSKKQSMLISCLKNNINDRVEIIEHIWGGEIDSAKTNKYNQLIYQIRRRLAKNEFPEDLLITLPHHGLYLNERYLHHEQLCDVFELKALNDQNLYRYIEMA